MSIERVPGTGGDVVRTLTVMPGVVNLQLPLGYSGVVIRGSRSILNAADAFVDPTASSTR